MFKTRATLFLVAVLLCAASTLSAQTNWTGGGGTSTWTTATNWSSGVPTSTTDAVILGTAAIMPTLSAGAACNSLTIQAGATLTGSTGTLAVYGNWTNSGTFTANTSTITFAGTTNATVSGATTFYAVIVNKGATTYTVTQNATASMTSTGNALDIQNGIWITNGQNLSVSGNLVRTTGTSGELRVTVGGTVNLTNIPTNGPNTLAVQAGTVNISGQHSIFNQGYLCRISGGTVNYTSTATNLYLATNSSTLTIPSGFAITAGTVNFSGSINTANFYTNFAASGTGVVNFVGTSNATVTMLNWPDAGPAQWDFNDLRFSKTLGASVTFQTANTGPLQSNVTVSAITVGAGAVANLGGRFSTGNGWTIPSITNSGTLNLNAGVGGTIYTVSGNITSNAGASLTGNSNTRVVISGATASTISGANTFYELHCTTAGRTVNFGAGTTTTIASQLYLVGTSVSRVALRSTSSGTQWNLQMNGGATARYVDVQDSNASSTVYATPGGLDSGNNTNWNFGGAVIALADTGTIQAAWANEANQVVSGSFTLQNTTTSSVTLNSITVGASGTGNDSTAYSEVALYRDNTSAGTIGSYDALDTLYGTAITAFGADNGTATFTAGDTIAASTTARFFAVVKFNGATLPSPGHTFQIRVTGFSVSGAAASHTPTLNMRGFQISQPTLNVSITSLTARPVAMQYQGPGNNGFEFHRFTITNTSPLPVSISTIQLDSYVTVSGAMGAIGYLRLYEDTNGSGGFEAGSDTQVGNSFTSWASFQSFTYVSPAGNFAANQTKSYFIVVKTNGATTPANGTQLGFYFSSSSTATGAIFAGNVQTVR
ncbi:MAG: hypothetical protein IT463_00500 [Planctomycetes bacterium]|nr:hypothetical protein [Planctomycetota bacterium]